MKKDLKLQKELTSVEIEDDGDVTFKDILKNSSQGGQGDKLILAWRYNQSIKKDNPQTHITGEFRDRICEYQFDLSKSV